MYVASYYVMACASGVGNVFTVACAVCPEQREIYIFKFLFFVAYNAGPGPLLSSEQAAR